MMGLREDKKKFNALIDDLTYLFDSKDKLISDLETKVRDYSKNPVSVEFPKEFIDYLYAFFVRNKEDTCKYCKHEITCNKEDCEKFESYGNKATAIYPDGTEIEQEHDCEFTCMDLNFGDCPMLENTPCHDCILFKCQHFEWDGTIPEDYESW